MGRGNTAIRLLMLLLLAGPSSLASAQEDNGGLRQSVSDDPVSQGDLPDLSESVPPPPPPPPRLTVGPEPLEDTLPEKTEPPSDDDAFEPIGVRVGGFIVRPETEFAGVVTDNVRQEDTNEKTDIGLQIVPRLLIESDWVRHALKVSAAGDFTFYDEAEDFNRRELDAEARLKLDMRHSTTLEFSSAYNLSERSPSDIEVPDAADERRQDQEITLLGALEHQFNRLKARISSGAAWLVFGDVSLGGGSIEDNSDRNYVEPSVTARLGYEVSATVTPFVEVGYAPRIRQEKFDRSGLERSSEGGFARAGVGIDVPELWSGEVALRFDVRDYDDPTLKTEQLFGLDADVTWRPTRLTSVRFTAGTGLAETSLAGVSAVRDYDARIEVRHELRENLAARAAFGIDYADYPGNGEDEILYDGTAELAYVITRNVELVAGYEFSQLDSEAPGEGYVENRVSLGLRFRL